MAELHNVPPDVLRSQLVWMRRHFDIVSLDALFDEPKPGKAAVTFDDGYLSVFREALPILLELGIPCTVFLNGCFLQGEALWRDDVRLLLRRNLAEEFLQMFHARTGKGAGITASEFYRWSKTDAVNSKILAEAVHAFLAERHVDAAQQTYGVRDPADLPRHPLVTYGNHTRHHYVLSSLSEEEQREEILGNKKLLEEWSLRSSRVFSLPFGNRNDFNEATLRILREGNIRGFVYSRNRLNFLRRRSLPQESGLLTAERLMVPDTLAGLQKHLLGLWVKGTGAVTIPAT